jgi:hypothetical protein
MISGLFIQEKTYGLFISAISENFSIQLALLDTLHFDINNFMFKSGMDQ